MGRAFYFKTMAWNICLYLFAFSHFYFSFWAIGSRIARSAFLPFAFALYLFLHSISFLLVCFWVIGFNGLDCYFLSLPPNVYCCTFLAFGPLALYVRLQYRCLFCILCSYFFCWLQSFTFLSLLDQSPAEKWDKGRSKPTWRNFHSGLQDSLENLVPDCLSRCALFAASPKPQKRQKALQVPVSDEGR